jgi:gliding motility-associated-like protein
MRRIIFSFCLIFSLSVYSQRQTVELCEDYRTTFTYYSSSNITGTWLWTVGADTVSTSNRVTISWTIPGTYEIVANFESGCPITPRSYWVHVIECAESAIYFPNSFTPNADGINDEWGPRGIGITKIKWTVYDRWGLQIYTSESMTDRWTGSFRDGDYYVQNDVYIYKADWIGKTGIAGSKIGHVTLIR